jgi:cell division protein FtsI (penicillin-binding protein 3)
MWRPPCVVVRARHEHRQAVRGADPAGARARRAEHRVRTPAAGAGDLGGEQPHRPGRTLATGHGVPAHRGHRGGDVFGKHAIARRQRRRARDRGRPQGSRPRTRAQFNLRGRLAMVCGTLGCARWRWSARALDLQLIDHAFYQQQGDARFVREIPIADLARHDHRPQRRAAGGVLAGGIDLGQSQGTAEGPGAPAGAGACAGHAAGRAASRLSQRAGQGIRLPQAPDQPRRSGAHPRARRPGRVLASASSAASTRRARRWPTCWASPTSTTAARKAWSWRSTTGCAAPRAQARDPRPPRPDRRERRPGPRRQPGKDLTLSIDRRIQYLAHRELRNAMNETGQQRLGGGAGRGHRRSAGDGQPARPSTRMRSGAPVPRRAPQPRGDRPDRAGLDHEAAHRGCRAGSGRDHPTSLFNTSPGWIPTASTAPPTPTTTACWTYHRHHPQEFERRRSLIAKR